MPKLFDSAPEPVSELGRFRILSTTSSLRVSLLALGAMSIGDVYMGSKDKGASFKLLDGYGARQLHRHSQQLPERAVGDVAGRVDGGAAEPRPDGDCDQVHGGVPVPRVFPVLGGRKIEHWQNNIRALTIQLTEEQIA